jgi:hypothetical protein
MSQLQKFNFFRTRQNSSIHEMSSDPEAMSASAQTTTSMTIPNGLRVNGKLDPSSPVLIKTSLMKQIKVNNGMHHGKLSA